MINTEPTNKLGWLGVGEVLEPRCSLRVSVHTIIVIIIMKLIKQVRHWRVRSKWFTSIFTVYEGLTSPPGPSPLYDCTISLSTRHLCFVSILDGHDIWRSCLWSFDKISTVILKYNVELRLGLWCLSSLLTIFQLYCGGQCYW